MYREEFWTRIERFVAPVGAVLGAFIGVMMVVVLALHKAPM